MLAYIFHKYSINTHVNFSSVVGRDGGLVGSLLTGVSAGGSGGEDSLSGVGDLGHVAVGVVSGVGDGLDTAVGKGDGVGASNVSGSISSLSSLEVGLGVVIGHTVLEGVGLGSLLVGNNRGGVVGRGSVDHGSVVSRGSVDHGSGMVGWGGVDSVHQGSSVNQGSSVHQAVSDVGSDTVVGGDTVSNVGDVGHLGGGGQAEEGGDHKSLKYTVLDSFTDFCLHVLLFTTLVQITSSPSFLFYQLFSTGRSLVAAPGLYTPAMAPTGACPTCSVHCCAVRCSAVHSAVCCTVKCSTVQSSVVFWESMDPPW